MSTDNQGQSAFDLDTALTKAEREEIGQALTQTQHFNPRAEFATQLEERLRKITQEQLFIRKSTDPGKDRWWSNHIPPQQTRRALSGLLTTAFFVALVTIWMFFGNGVATTSAAEMLKKAEEANSFVPAGQMRHLVIRHTMSSTVTEAAHSTLSEEVWLANGRNHLLMRKSGPLPNDVMLVNDESVWNYSPTHNNNVVSKVPYHPRFLSYGWAPFMPNEELIKALMRQSNTRVVSDTTSNSRTLIVIEHTADTVPSDWRPGDDVIDYRVWIDQQTYQFVRWQSISRQVADGHFTGKVDTVDSMVVLNELQDMPSVRADFFIFKMPAGAKLIESSSIATPTPTR